MKIRCTKCYKVLEPLEEYCTNCGEHSEKIALSMKYGSSENKDITKLKISFIVFALCAFLATGIFQTIFAVISNDATSSIYNRLNGMFFSSILTGIILIIINRKAFNNSLINTNIKTILSASLLCVFIGCIVVISNLLTDFTCFIPNYIRDYLLSDDVTIINNSIINVSTIIISFILVTLSEEILFRKLFIDYLDENTLLSDLLVIIFSSILATLLDFAWLMSVETLLLSFVLNTFLSCCYIYTNRSTLPNIILKLTIVLTIIFIYMK